MLLVEMCPCGDFQTNAIFLGDTETKKGVCIDPGDGALDWFTKKSDDWTLEAIWLTHSHFDHIVDAAALKDKFDLPLFVHQVDAPNVEKPGSDGLSFMVVVAPTKVDHFFEEGQRLKLGVHEFEVMHLPGHSPGSVAFYSKSDALLIAGDVLFKAGYGRTDLPGSDPVKMTNSLKRLCLLPEDTVVYPGHGETTTIKDESWRYQ